MFDATVLLEVALLRVEVPLVDPTEVLRVSAPVFPKPVSDRVSVYLVVTQL
jgi:hypothetical protein